MRGDILAARPLSNIQLGRSAFRLPSSTTYSGSSPFLGAAVLRHRTRRVVKRITSLGPCGPARAKSARALVWPMASTTRALGPGPGWDGWHSQQVIDTQWGRAFAEHAVHRNDLIRLTSPASMQMSMGRVRRLKHHVNWYFCGIGISVLPLQGVCMATHAASEAVVSTEGTPPPRQVTAVAAHGTSCTDRSHPQGPDQRAGRGRIDP